MERGLQDDWKRMRKELRKQIAELGPLRPLTRVAATAINRSGHIELMRHRLYNLEALMIEYDVALD